jgi:hypothetical protein
MEAMTDKECTKCIHKEVCKTAESCDGFVSGCKHFKDEKWVNELEKRIAELEPQVVRMQCRDDIINQKRVFEIRYSDMLDPEEAMDIFVRNIQRIFKSGADMRGE